MLEGSVQRRNLWPPALLGVCEAVLYPTAFIVGHTDFIGLWLLLKVAGQWPRWGLESSIVKEKGQDALHEGAPSLLPVSDRQRPHGVGRARYIRVRQDVRAQVRRGEQGSSNVPMNPSRDSRRAQVKPHGARGSRAWR